MRFNRFRREFNEDRPHEALEQDTPASHYRRSPRQLPRKLSPFDYPAHYEVRLVSANGGMRWRCKRVNVTTTLIGEYVGLEEIGDGLWDVYFCHVRLGRLDERRMRIEDEPGRWVRGKKPTEVSPMSPD